MNQNNEKLKFYEKFGVPDEEYIREIENLVIEDAIRTGRDDFQRAVIAKEKLLSLKDDFGKLTYSGEELLYQLSRAPYERHYRDETDMMYAYLDKERNVTYNVRV